ncbi:MAG: hypothetical protein K8R21_12270 [Leptospira sp.]|nr:hypothetical protein [Leptospira sp.]
MKFFKSNKAAFYILFTSALLFSAYSDGKISPVEEYRSTTSYFQIHDFDHTEDDFYLHGSRKFDFFDLFENAVSNLNFEKINNYTLSFQYSSIAPVQSISYIFIDIPPPLT